MEITEVRITLVDGGNLKAIASITLDNSFVIRGLKIIGGVSGTFVAMPSRRLANGEYADIAHPINNSTRKWMEDIVLAKYEEELNDRQPPRAMAVALPVPQPVVRLRVGANRRLTERWQPGHDA